MEYYSYMDRKEFKHLLFLIIITIAIAIAIAIAITIAIAIAIAIAITITITITIVFTEIMIFCMFKWREQFTHSPRPATRHRPDSDAGQSNVGPTSGRQHRWWANAGPTPAMHRPGGSCHSQWNRRPRTVSECNQSSYKSLCKLHISI